MLTMFTYALGGVDLDIMLGSSNPEASILLSLLYQFAIGTLLMSLLTGVMAQAMYRVRLQHLLTSLRWQCPARHPACSNLACLASSSQAAVLCPVALCLDPKLLQATAHEDLKRLLSKAQAIDELESTIPSFVEKLMPNNYPAFVHVLRVRHARVTLPACLPAHNTVWLADHSDCTAGLTHNQLIDVCTIGWCPFCCRRSTRMRMMMQ